MSGGKPVSVIIPKATTKALSSMKELRPVRADAELKRPSAWGRLRRPSAS
jgi:hypothetical protein